MQIGLLAEDPRVPLGAVIAGELAILGSHGMPAHDYPELLALVENGALRPQDLVTRRIRLEDTPEALAGMSAAVPASGVTLIDLTL